jgi:hypothetical protein
MIQSLIYIGPAKKVEGLSSICSDTSHGSLEGNEGTMAHMSTHSNQRILSSMNKLYDIIFYTFIKH